MSIAIQDRTADRGAGNNKNRVYNDVARPDNKVVHVGLNARHRMLTSMFPSYTPRAERIIDFLMGLNNDEFAVLCHHEGPTLCITVSKLDIIGDALDAAQQTGEAVELDLTGIDPDVPLDELDGPDDYALRLCEKDREAVMFEARKLRAG